MTSIKPCVKKESSLSCSQESSHATRTPQEMIRKVRSGSPILGNFLQNSNIHYLESSEKIIVMEALTFQKENTKDTVILPLIHNVDHGFFENDNIPFLKYSLKVLYQEYLDRYAVAKEGDISFYRQKLVTIKNLLQKI